MRTLGIVFGAALALLVFTSSGTAWAQCACECIDADGEVDANGNPIIDDLECCTPTDATDPAGTAGNLQEYGVCGCIDVQGQAAANGWINPVPSGCINVGENDTNDVLMEDASCNDDGLTACRNGGCTTVTLDAPDCS